MKIIQAVFLTLLISLQSLSADSLRNLPYSDPVYKFLEKAYTMGWIKYLPQSKPYSVDQALEFLSEIENNSDYLPDKYPLAADQLKVLRTRLRENSSFMLYSAWEGNNSASLDFPLSISGNMRLNEPADSFLSTIQTIDARASLAGRLYFSLYTVFGESLAIWQQAPFQKFFFPLREEYSFYYFFLSRGTHGFSHLDQLSVLHQPGEVDLFIWMNSLSQNTVDFGLGTLTLARNALDWGPSALSNLALSATAKPYEHLLLNIPLGKTGSFIWMTGFLQDFTGQGMREYVDKLINVHRIEFQLFDWLLFAVYESIIYSNRFEMAYLNPLGIYVVSEVRRGDYDNKLGGFDMIFRIPKLKAYVSFFTDDWDFGHPLSFNYYHNEWAGIIGLNLFELFPNLSIRMEYIHLTHWMYTHKDVSTDEGYNFNRYKHFDAHLGHFLGPNSHMIYLRLDYELDTRFNFGTSFWFTQDGRDSKDGRGSIDSAPDWTYEQTLPGWPYNDFLDGIVETNLDWSLFAEYRIPESRISIKASYSLEYTKNYDWVTDQNRWDHILCLSADWKVY